MAAMRIQVMQESIAGRIGFLICFRIQLTGLKSLQSREALIIDTMRILRCTFDEGQWHIAHILDVGRHHRMRQFMSNRAVKISNRLLRDTIGVVLIQRIIKLRIDTHRQLRRRAAFGPGIRHPGQRIIHP